MSIIISGATGSDYETVPEGTHNAVLKGAQAYMKDAFDDDKPPVPALTLIWETDEEGENGQPLAVFDSFLTMSANEKATLTKRFRPLVSNKNTREWQLEVRLENDADLTDLPHWRDEKITVDSILLNGEELLGMEAMIGVSHNANGYAKVDSVVAAPKKKAGRRAP